MVSNRIVWTTLCDGATRPKTGSKYSQYSGLAPHPNPRLLSWTSKVLYFPQQLVINSHYWSPGMMSKTSTCHEGATRQSSLASKFCLISKNLNDSSQQSLAPKSSNLKFNPSKGVSQSLSPPPYLFYLRTHSDKEGECVSACGCVCVWEREREWERLREELKFLFPPLLIDDSWGMLPRWVHVELRNGRHLCVDAKTSLTTGTTTTVATTTLTRRQNVGVFLQIAQKNLMHYGKIGPLMTWDVFVENCEKDLNEMMSLLQNWFLAEQIFS